MKHRTINIAYRTTAVRQGTAIALWVFCLLCITGALFAQSNEDNIRFTQGEVGINGAMSIGVPLGHYKGRGIDLPVSISYSSNVWNIEYLGKVYINGTGRSVVGAIFAKNAVAGWKSSLDLPTIEFPKPHDVYNCKGLTSGSGPYRIRKVFIHMPDGSTHELRKTDYPESGGVDMTGTFYAVDGSRIRFEANGTPDTGTIYMADGTRYILGHPLSYIIDRHGNTLTYDENSRQWTDTLGRVIVNPLPSTPQIGDFQYSLPGLAGVNGGLQTYTFKWRNLADSLTPGENGTPALRYVADHYLPYPGGAPDSGNIPQPQPSNPGNSFFHTAYSYKNGDAGLTPATIKPTIAVGKGQWVGALFDPVVLTEIVLPDGTAYKFSYNEYAELNKVIYPSNAYADYEYETAPMEIAGYWTDGNPVAYNKPYDQGKRRVKTRRLSMDGTGNDIKVWTYAETADGKTSIVAPDMTRTEIQKYFTSQEAHDGFDPPMPFGSGDSRDGIVRERRFYSSSPDGLGGNLLRREIIDYAQSTNNFSVTFPCSGVPWTTVVGAKRNARPVKTVNIIFEGTGPALAQTTTLEYDTTNEFTTGIDQTRVNAYHYAVVDNATAKNGDINQIPTGALARITEALYLNDPTYRAANMLGLLSETRVLNPANPSDVLAKSQFVYDEPAYFDNSYTTTGWEDPQSNLRGNVTTTRTWHAETSSWIESHTMFDNFGNPRKVWDTSGDPTRFIETEYDPIYKYAYPTKTKAPAPDPTGVHGTTEGSEITRVYDFTTGLLLSVTDAHGQTTTNEYNDPLLRPTRILPPAGGPITEIIYNDTPNNIWVKVRRQIDEHNWGEAASQMDNLGRIYLIRKNDSQGEVFVETKYDGFGRVEGISNPYRNGEQKLWSKPRYDHANRVVENFAPAPEGQTGPSLGTVEFGISTVPGFVGTYVTGTDASGRKARSIKNALGQILRVDEPTGNNDLGSLENPNQPSYYTYNVRGELIKAQQGQQHRYFMYDSLGRLIRVRQPEQTVNTSLNTTGNPENNSWTAGFTYDVLGNLLTVTDAKGTVITNTFDNAGRVTSRSYADGITPRVDYYYDGKGLPQSPQFARGHLTKMSSSVSETTYTEFDNLGRLLSSQQITDGETYDFSYAYNLSGDLIEQTYPSGRAVKNFLAPDGGLSAVSSRAAHGSFKTFVSNFDYDASGAVRSMMLGNGKWETFQYNSRFQLTEIGLGNSPTDTSLWKTEYEYGELNTDGTTVDTTKNIGNIAKQTTTLPGAGFVQTYKYDEVNRLIEATEKTGSTQNWRQTFAYDRYGNRTGFYQIVGIVELPTNNVTKPNIDPATNRFSAGQGYVYDFNGNLVQDAEGRAFTFDGNDKQIEVRDAAQNVIGQYFYDGDGFRVKKITNTETTVFVYDGFGKLVAEYSTEVNQEPTTSYLTTDHLGSPRIITDETGSVISRRDFMPFGEELFAGVGPRTEGMKYGGSQIDNIRQRFTGYEKDWETDLDFAEARMYQNKHGRFTAPDPLLSSASTFNPQTFNRYIYTSNNPVNFVDPSGLAWCQNGSRGPIEWQGQCQEGWTNVDNRYRQCFSGTCELDGQTFGPGTVVFLKDDRTFEVIKNPTQEQLAQAAEEIGSEVQAAHEEIASSNASLGDHVHSALMTIGENNGGNAIDYVFDLQPYDRHTEIGQRAGNAVTIVQGLAEIVIGGIMAGGGGTLTIFTSPACATGVGCVIPASTATVSVTGLVVVAHGAGVIGNTIYNMANNQGPGSRSGWKNTKENVERMKQGRAPKDGNGNAIELHHKGQNPDGELIPMTREQHRGKGNHSKNHPNRGPSKVTPKVRKRDRERYWKNKAKELK